MTAPSIGIIGAGLAGLTLGRCLGRLGLSTVIYEKSTRTGRNAYAISLGENTCNALSKQTGIELGVLDEDLSVIQHQARTSGDRRILRNRLEETLAQGLDIRRGHAVGRVDLSGPQPRVLFDNDTSVKHDLVVDTSGVHSVIRAALLPHAQPAILPFAAYSGKRRLSHAKYQATYAKAFQSQPTLVKDVRTPHGARLEITLSSKAQLDGDVDIRYTYSRPARAELQADPLARPERSNESATDTPDELFDEVQQTSSDNGLTGIWADAFDGDQMKQDRILNWLMRTVLVDQSDLMNLAGKGLLLMGDAAHASPILGGKGANVSMTDALEFSQSLSQHDKSKLTGLTQVFIRERYQAWEDEHRACQARIKEMHVHDVSRL